MGYSSLCLLGYGYGCCDGGGKVLCYHPDDRHDGRTFDLDGDSPLKVTVCSNDERNGLCPYTLRCDGDVCYTRCVDSCLGIYGRCDDRNAVDHGDPHSGVASWYPRVE